MHEFPREQWFADMHVRSMNFLEKFEYMQFHEHTKKKASAVGNIVVNGWV